MQDLETMLLPCDNFLFFFDVKPRPSVAAKSGSKFWQLIPRQLDDPEQCGLHGAFASIARRIAQRKLSQTSLATLANLMNSLTFKKDHAGFLEGESTIFLATHEASRTGAPLLLLQLVQQLAMRGWECVVLIDREGEVEDEFARFAHVINFRGRQSKYAECKDYLALLFADLKFHKPKLCLLNSLETGHFAQPLRENGIKVVTFVHELADTYPCAFLKAVFEKSELVVFPAQFVRNSAREKLGIESLNDLVIPSALLDENFGAYSLPQARRELREEIQASENAFVVLACGTPDIRKGIDIFVHVAQVILKKVAAEQEVHFTWIGAGRVINLSPHYYAFWDVRQAALTSRIHLLPPRKNLRPAFRGADLFVLPSRQDPFPCVVHNAMAAELPIVAFQDAGGVQEMLVDGGVKMIPYGDIMAFADAVFSYLTDAEERIRHGKLNAHLVRERFQFSEYISKIENALDLKF
jgi:glycosyltransferase involved in cell wall biosynthesis